VCNHSPWQAETSLTSHTHTSPATHLGFHARGVWVAEPVDMSAVEVDRRFLELTANVIAGRVYRLSTNNFLMNTGTFYYRAFRYTPCDNGDRIPTVNCHDWAVSRFLDRSFGFSFLLRRSG